MPSVKRPPVVQRAVMRNDLATLRFYGSAGGRKSAKRRAERAEANAYLAEKAAQEEYSRLVTTNEHIAPID